MKKLTLFLLCAVMSATGLMAITVTVGGGSTTAGVHYATLKEAFDHINAASNGMTGTINIKVIDNTTETAPAAITKDGVTVLVYPTVTGKIITMNAVSGTVFINGADNVTIDGRLRDGSGTILGSTPDLTIENTFNGTSAATNCAIRIEKGSTLATYNTVTYCNIKGSNGAVVYLNPNNATTPTATNNTISYNKFSPAVVSPSVVRPGIVINTVKGVHSDIYTRNNFENVCKSDGIRLQDQAVDCEISYNSFYETVAFNSGANVTYINVVGSGAPRTGNVIKNNYIGGNAPECIGTMTKSTGTNYSFLGISVSASSSGTKVQNNTIKNITWANNGTAAFCGIYVFTNADLITTIDGNFISGIDYNYPTNSTTLYGIRKSGNSATGTALSGIATISNNIVYLNDSYTNTVYGIAENSLAGQTTNVYFNTVYIAGTSASASYAFYSRTNVNTRDFRNNIFVNTRAAGTHYAAYFNYGVATGLTLSNNDYFVDGAGGVQGYNGANVTSLPLIATLDAGSSIATPGITPGTTPESFKGTASLTATTIASVTTDFTGNKRSSSPLMGAYESSLWNGTSWVGGAPTASTSAVINGDFTTGGFDCFDLIINPAKQVTISNPSTVAGALTLKSDAANGTATLIDNAILTVTGATKVEQHLSNGRNWYFSSPVSGATSNVLAASATNPVYYYVENTPNVWSSITNTSTTLDAKTGYVANINGDRVVTFTGGSLNTGEQTIGSLTSTGATFTGFNLVGNPYPSYLKWSGAARTNVGTSIWYRSKRTGAYLFETYNSDGGARTNGGTDSIPPMQAFWVKVTAGETGSIVFDVNDRAHRDQSVSANRLKAPAVDIRKTLRLEVSNGSNADEALIYADENAQNGFDTYDSNKMFANSASVPEIYTVLGAEKLAINGFNDIAENQQLALGFKTSVAGTASFSIKASEVKNFAAGTKIILKDNTRLGEEFDITDGTVYNYTSGATNDASRFSILFRAPGATTGVNTVEKLNAQVFVNAANQITIVAPEKSNYTIYNAVGMQLENGQTTAKLQTVNCKLQTGVYLVKVSENGRNYTSRVIIK